MLLTNVLLLNHSIHNNLKHLKIGLMSSERFICPPLFITQKLCHVKIGQNRQFPKGKFINIGITPNRDPLTVSPSIFMLLSIKFGLSYLFHHWNPFLRSKCGRRLLFSKDLGSHRQKLSNYFKKPLDRDTFEVWSLKHRQWLWLHMCTVRLKVG